MTREEAKGFLIDISYTLGSIAVEFLTEKDAEKMREAIEVLEREHCEDEYIKVPKKALKYRTAGMVAYNAEWLKNHFDIERAVICGAQQPCNDAISRQAVIDAFERFIHELGIEDEPYNYGEMALSVKNVPPVTSYPKTGHWITHIKSDRGGDYWPTNPKCSECDGEPYYSNSIFDYKFCPYCGAKMSEIPTGSELQERSE